jgi:hypothetical protein
VGSPVDVFISYASQDEERRTELEKRLASRPLLERAVAIAEARLPPDHPSLALYRKHVADLGPPP